MHEVRIGLAQYDELLAAADYLDRPDPEVVALTKARVRSLVASSA